MSEVIKCCEEKYIWEMRVGQCQQNDGICRVVMILNKMVREGLADKVAAEDGKMMCVNTRGLPCKQ